MAKRKRSNDISPEIRGPTGQDQVAQKVPGPQITVPQGDLPADANSEPLHINLNLTRHQSMVVRRLRVALLERQAICKTGAPGRDKLVTNQADAVRWLLEQVPL